METEAIKEYTFGYGHWTNSFYPKQYYLEKLRLVRCWDEEQKREFVFLTNGMGISVLQVVQLYKNRWQLSYFSNGLNNT